MAHLHGQHVNWPHLERRNSAVTLGAREDGRGDFSLSLSDVLTPTASHSAGAKDSETLTFIDNPPGLLQQLKLTFDL